MAEQAGCRLLLRARLSGKRQEKQPAQEGIGFVRSSTGMIPYGCRPRPRGAEAQRHRGSGLKAQAKGSASYMSADEESIALVVGAWLARQSVVVAPGPKKTQLRPMSAPRKLARSSNVLPVLYEVQPLSTRVCSCPYT